MADPTPTRAPGGRLYKVLSEDGRGPYSGFVWPLPDGDRPGAWLPPIAGELVPCRRGYHLCRPGDLLAWLGPAIYEAEWRGESLDAADKIVVREARLVRRVAAWDDRAARHFACDCAERVLPIYERATPGDARPRTAIAVARRFADGLATAAELAAAGAAAWDAAWDAAWAAAWDAAWDAARDAERDAERAAAWAAARDWQTARLLAYLDGTAIAATAQGDRP